MYNGWEKLDMKIRIKYFLAGFLFLLTLSVITPSVSAQTRPDALAEYRAGNFERAVLICREELAENPNNLESHVVICWSLIRLNRLEEAMRYARTARSLYRFDVRITQIMGEISYYQGRNDEALQYFQEYANTAPEGQRIDQVYYLMGEVYIRQGKFRHADIALSTAVHWVPNNAAWWVRLAYTRENAGDLSSAIEAYERALSLNSQLTDAQRGIERTRRTLGAQ
jgi:tetratricopeptide (TPR) repeat protein